MPNPQRIKTSTDETSVTSGTSIFSKGNSSSKSINQTTASHAEANDLNIEHLQQAFQQFNRLSENFVHSYQDLEDQVESLADKLAREVSNKQHQLIEKEKAASRLQSLLSILPAGVVVIDEHGYVQDCNAVSVDLLGRPLLGEKWIAIIQRSFAPRLDDGHEVSLKDGRRVHIETRSLDYEPGQLIVLTDLTETRKLQDKVNQDKRLSSMGKMMASLAHQIRTPLSSALIYADGLSNTNMGKDKQKKFSEKLVSCLTHLDRHINDMLQFARSGGLQKSIKPCTEISQAVSQHATDHYPELIINNDTNHTFNVELNLDAVLSALSNIIDNAFQACEKNQLAEVSLSITTQDNLIMFKVSDNGEGIEQKKIDKILDPFYTTKSGGTGLGLAVVHGAVKAHQGELNIQSEIGKGTDITLTLYRAITLNAVEGSHHEH
jgi:two-component system sensor histidine kinase FlrB